MSRRAALRIPAAIVIFALTGAVTTTEQTPTPSTTPTAPSAQTPGAPSPTFRSDVDLVQLDVSVLDRERRAVRGLTAEDFVVLDEGRPQTIVAFRAIEVAAAAVEPEGWQRDVPLDVTHNRLDERRLVVIVIDNAELLRDPTIWPTMKQLGRDVVAGLGRDDLAAVAFVGTGRGQNFTTDRAKLLAAVDGAQISGLGAAGRLPTGEYGLLRVLRNTIDSLQSVTELRKIVFLIGPNGLNPAGLDPLLQKALRDLQRTNITVNALDPTGLSRLAIAAGQRNPLPAIRGVQARQDSLRTFADFTGGRVVVNSNAPENYVPAMFEENSAYYLLGFVPAAMKADGRLHEVAVKIAGRPDLEVRTRKGYYAPVPPGRRVRDPLAGRSPVERALASGVAVPGLPLSLSSNVVATTDRRRGEVVLAVKVHAEAAERRSAQAIDLVAAAFDSTFKERAAHRQRIDLASPNPPKVVRDEDGFTAFSRLTVAPGAYEVRVSAELGGDIGTVFAEVNVPSFAKDDLSASTLVLSNTPAVAVAPQAASDLLPLLPTTARAFSPGDRVVGFLRIYLGGSGPTGPVAVEANVLTGTGQSAFNETTTIDAARFGTGRAADYQVRVPTDTLAPGMHLLRVTLRSGDNIVQRDVPFSIK